MEEEVEDNFFSDDGIEDLPSATLLELEENACAATQRQRAESETLQQHNYHDDDDQLQNPREGQQQQQQQGQSLGVAHARPPLQQRYSTSTTSYHGSASGNGPYRATANPGLSFGDADLQYLDAGVLDDGAGPVPVDQQDAVMILDQQTDERHTTHASAYGDGADRQTHPIATKWRRYGHDLHDNEDNNDNSNNAGNYAAAQDNAADAGRMREQVEQLTRERETMMQELGAAKAMVETRAGEIAIIRANQTKLQRTHDEQLTSLRSAMTEQVRKHQAAVDATAMESKRVTTENVFLKQDLREETFREKERERAWRAQKKGDEKTKTAEGHQTPVTPKKSKDLPFRDGFDDDEIMASPSKPGGRRSGRATPTAQGKRKRRVADDSPRGSMLQLSQSFDHHEGAEPIPVDGEEDETKGLTKRPRRQEDLNVRFMRSILNHRTPPHQLRDLEVFAGMSFPSQPDRAFSSFILEATTGGSSSSSSSSTSTSHSNYAVSYAQALISLWSRALDEKFYTPISILMAVTKFVLSLDPRRLAPPLLADLVPVLRESAYVNGMVRFQNSPNWHLNRGQVKQTPLRELHPEVSGTEALEILYMIATSGCMDVADDNSTDGGGSGSAIAEFWTRIRLEFVLMMLNAYQPVADITLMLNLLSCSIQGQPVPTFSNGNSNNSKDNDTSDGNATSKDYYTFGPIHGTAADQTENENYILDRAAHLLSATPSVDEGQPPCSECEITALRLEVMYFLTEVAFSSPPPGQKGAGAGGSSKGGNGLALLAWHPSALARIFRAMHDELDALYAAHAEDEREVHAELVNGLTRLAYGVLHSASGSNSDGGGAADKNENGDDKTGGTRGGGQGAQPQLNLHTVPGAVQKHLVVLTRLAFSERGALPASAPSSSSAAGGATTRANDNNAEEGDEGDREDDPAGPPRQEASSSRGVNVLLEAGIDLDTVEMAHEMLEEVVNPQEAEALVEVFRPGLAAGEPQEG